MISTDMKRVAALERAIRPTLTDEDATRVHFLTPDGFFQLVEELDAKDANRDEMVHGYRVKVSR